MASRLKNGHDPSSPSLSSANGSLGYLPPSLTDSQLAILELIRVARVLLRASPLIICVTLIVAGYIGVREKYFSVKWYRAQALITPVSPDSSLASSVGEGTTLGQTSSSLMDLFTGGESDNVTISERYIAIMDSYAFTTDLINRYHLDRRIVKSTNGHVPRISPWKMSQAITGRFQTEYDYKSGNLALYYMDPDPAEAKSILEDYLVSLREKVRSEEVQSAAAAVDSLQDEISKTSDALLQNQLYELVARQIQREKIARVQADFAFKIIEPPVVPDNFYAPQARRDATIAGALTFALMCIAVLAWDFISRTRRQLAALETAMNHSLPRAPRPAAETFSPIKEPHGLPKPEPPARRD